jgi:hypothetical protein
MGAEEEGMTICRHSGRREASTSDAQLRIGESRDDDCWIPGSSLRDAPE